MDEDERSIDELIEIAEEIPDRLGLGAGMAELRGSAGGEGVSVTVDVGGMLVGLDIDEAGLALGPQRLAAEISRLSVQASDAVLRSGLRAVRAGCTPQVATAIADFLGIDDIDGGVSGDSAVGAVDGGSVEASAGTAGLGRREPGSPAEADRAARQPTRAGRRASVPDDDDPDGFVLTPV